MAKRTGNEMLFPDSTSSLCDRAAVVFVERFLNQRFALTPAPKKLAFQRRQHGIRLAHGWISAQCAFGGLASVVGQACTVGTRQPKRFQL